MYLYVLHNSVILDLTGFAVASGLVETRTSTLRALFTQLHFVCTL